MKRLILLLLLALCSPAWGQGVLFTAQALTTVQVNGVPVLAAQPYAPTTVCQLSANACTVVPIYSDQAMTMPITMSLFATDGQGNVTFWAPAANYQYTFCPVNSVNCYTYAISGGSPAVCTSSGACQGVVLSAPAGSQTIAQPAGSVLSVTTPGNFTGIFSQPNQYLQNGMTQGMIEAMQGATGGSPNTGSLADVLTCGQLIPNGATAGQNDCYSAFQLAGTTMPTVGYYSRVEPSIAGTNLWGGNDNISDTDDVNGVTYANTTIFGHEIDVNVASASTAGAALFFGSIFKVQPGNMGAIHLPLPDLFASYPHYWSYGFLTDPGAVTGCTICEGAALPTVAANPSVGTLASASQYDQFVWRDTSGANHASILSVDDTGTYTILSENGVDIPTGDISTDNGSYINTTANAGLVLGSPQTANTPIINMYSSGNGGASNHYDVQIEAEGGTPVQGQGTLNITASQVIAPGLVTTQSTPGSSSAVCTAGAIWSDATYLYVCTATNTIKRAALSTF